MRKTILLYLIHFLLLSVPTFLSGQASADTMTFFQKLVADEIMSITLEADFDSLIENRQLNTEREAKFTFQCKSGNHEELSLKVRLRGAFRRKYCERPPLRLNFEKADLKAMNLRPAFDKLKLVTQCMKIDDAEQVLLREFWTYKMYNQITPNSFKVHLVNITFVNTRNPDEVEEQYGFFIENTKEMAHRLGGEINESFGLTIDDVNHTAYHNSVLFNYMIGNLDSQLAIQKNMKLVEHPEQGIIIVPYDFDMSAMVWPPYARLNPDFNQHNFKDRFCVGKFYSKEALNQTIEQFVALEGNYIKDINDCSYLDTFSKRHMLNYMDSFFSLVKRDKRVKRVFAEYIEK